MLKGICRKESLTVDIRVLFGFPFHFFGYNGSQTAYCPCPIPSDKFLHFLYVTLHKVLPVHLKRGFLMAEIKSRKPGSHEIVQFLSTYIGLTEFPFHEPFW